MRIIGCFPDPPPQLVAGGGDMQYLRNILILYLPSVTVFSVLFVFFYLKFCHLRSYKSTVCLASQVSGHMMDIANIHPEAPETVELNENTQGPLGVTTSNAIKNIKNIHQNFLKEEDFLKEHGFERCFEAFMEQEVSLKYMARLTNRDLATLGIHTIGARLRFRDAVASWELNEKETTTPKPVLEELSANNLEQNFLVTVERSGDKEACTNSVTDPTEIPTKRFKSRLDIVRNAHIKGIL